MERGREELEEGGRDGEIQSSSLEEICMLLCSCQEFNAGEFTTRTIHIH